LKTLKIPLCIAAAVILLSFFSCGNVALPVFYSHTPAVTDIFTQDETTPAVTLNSVSFIGAGDNLIHPSAYIDARNRATSETRKYNFKPMYANISDLIANADIAFINQETPLAGESYGYSGWPNFNSPQDLGYDLADIGFDVINIANNHMLDKGTKGLNDTIEFLHSLPVETIGGYLNEEDRNDLRIIEKNGIKTAFIAFTYGTNGISLSKSSDIVIPYNNDSDIVERIEIAKEAADAVIVSIHWGSENTFTPSAEQKRLAKLIADTGADAIIGHHPHVLQPIEWIERESGGKTLCVYSLGNLVGTMERGQNAVGGLITFDIVKYGEDEISIENVLFIPTIFYFGPSYYNSTIYLMEDFTEELAKSHGTKVYGYQVSFDTLKSYVFKNIDESFLS